MALTVAGPERKCFLRQLARRISPHQLSSAIRTGDLNLTDHTNSLQSLLDKGAKFERFGMYERAADHYFDYLKLQPYDLTALRRVRSVILEKSYKPFKVPELIACLEKALESLKDNLHLRNDLGLAYFHSGRVDLSKRIFENLLEMEKVKEDPQFHSLILSNLGYTLSKLGYTGKAVQVFEDALKLDAGNANARIEIARLIGSPEFDRFQDALSILNEMIEEDRHNAQLHSTIARILFDNKKFAEAVGPLKKCIGIEPGNPQHLVDLAKNYTNLDMNFTASWYYIKALEILWGTDERKNVLKELGGAIGVGVKHLFSLKKVG